MPDLNSWKNVVLLQGEGHESHDSERSNQASPFSDLEVLPNLRMHQRRRFRGDQSTRVTSPRLATRLGCANKLIDLIADIGLFSAHCTEIVKSSRGCEMWCEKRSAAGSLHGQNYLLLLSSSSANELTVLMRKDPTKKTIMRVHHSPIESNRSKRDRNRTYKRDCFTSVRCSEGELERA